MKKDTSIMNGMNKKPHIVTIFGGTGDLTYRKLLPAFYNLMETNHLPDDFHIVIIGRQDLTTSTYRELAKNWIHEHSRYKVHDEKLEEFLNYVTYFEMIFTEEEGYYRLKEYYQSLSPNACHLYYFAVAPAFFEAIAINLGKANLASNSKVIIEKPFGNDLESAGQINKTLTSIFSETSIYRIDHYVAKEMVQNIFTIRFANTLFTNIWNSDNIKSIQISANELVGVENRGNYYDHTGALKDMFQNHLLQILSIVTMDKPTDFEAESIHEKQEEILENLYIESINDDVVLGQYTGDGNSKSYRDEERVYASSTTETFVALKLGLHHPRWENTPIYVRTGKRMHKRATEVVIEFKALNNEKPNVLIIKIQPDEGVYLRFNIKKPGQGNDVQTVFMDFCQSCNYENRVNTPEAYERLLNAALDGDRTLFASYKQVELSWMFVEDIVNQVNHQDIQFYEAFTSGPHKAHELLKRDGNHWIEEEVYGENYISSIE